MQKAITIAILSVVFSGCQGNERLAEKAAIEGEAGALKQVEAENENLKRLASQDEERLALLHAFYQSIRGTYEGTFTSELGKLNIRINLDPSRFPNQYPPSHVRTREEISAEIIALNLDVQIKQWKTGDDQVVGSCATKGIIPDVAGNNVTVPAGPECPALYRFRFDGTDTLEGEFQPTKNAAVYRFSVRKTEQKQ